MSPVETSLLLFTFCKLGSYISGTYAGTDIKVSVFRVFNDENQTSINGEILDTVTVMSGLDCAGHCSRRPGCGGYSFHDTIGICHIKSHVASNPAAKSHVATYRKLVSTTPKATGNPTTVATPEATTMVTSPPATSPVTTSSPATSTMTTTTAAITTMTTTDMPKCVMKSIQVSSRNNETFPITDATEILNVTLIQEHDNNPGESNCIFGWDVFFGGNEIVASSRCNADFRVCYT